MTLYVELLLIVA